MKTLGETFLKMTQALSRPTKERIAYDALTKPQRNVRAELRDEALACQKDPQRNLDALQALLEEHGAMPDFDTWADGAVENMVIGFLTMRESQYEKGTTNE